METEQNKIELRSGKVRNIIGQIPPFWVRTGTVVIILILIALGYAAWKVPYPFTVEAGGTVEKTVPSGFRGNAGKYCIRLLVPYRYNDYFHEPRRVSLTFEGRDGVSLSYRIGNVFDSVITRDGEDYFSAFIPIDGRDAVRYRLVSGMKVRAVCTVSDRTVWQRIWAR
jgi:hypothetical protein|nr:hypothetical protein [uncultured Prevotella sp.]